MLINVGVLRDNAYGTGYKSGTDLEVDSETFKTTDGRHMNIPVHLDIDGEPYISPRYSDEFVITHILDEEDLAEDPFKAQVGGDHYRIMYIQPVDYIHKNGIGYLEGNVIKYVSRWQNKNGVEDLKKARHYLDMLIELEDI